MFSFLPKSIIEGNGVVHRLRVEFWTHAGRIKKRQYSLGFANICTPFGEIRIEEVFRKAYLKHAGRFEKLVELVSRDFARFDMTLAPLAVLLSSHGEASPAIPRLQVADFSQPLRPFDHSLELRVHDVTLTSN